MAAPQGIDGKSFLPALLGRADEQREHDFLFWDFPGYGGQLAVRAGRWKAVRRGLRQDPDAPLELYDLEADPAETTDVAKEHPDVADRLAKLIVSEREEPRYEKLRFGEYAKGE